MKKFLVILALTSMSLISEAQPLPNSGFENWTNKVFYSNPNPYSTTNAQLFMGGASGNVTRVSDAKSGSYAVKLTTVSINSDTMPAGIFLGSPGDGGLKGGYPFDQRPDSFGFFYKSQFNSTDTGMVVLFFKYKGNVIGVCGMSLTGNHSSYTRMCEEITFFGPVTPDSVAMVIFSSDPDKGGSPGSFLQLDSLFLIGATKKLPNPSFETWQDVKAEEADGWMSSNSFLAPGSSPNVIKSTDKHGGNYSVKITTAAAGFGQNTGFITNGNVRGEHGPSGGTPVNANPKKISFWYKYTPVGNDTGIAGVWTNKWDTKGDSSEIIEKEILKLKSASTWTYGEVLMNYNHSSRKADSVVIAFAPSNLDDMNSVPKAGSMLMIDDVSIEYYPNTIKKLTSNFLQAWPVPASSGLNLNLNGYSGTDARIKIYSMEGVLVKEVIVEVKEGKAFTDISNLSNGNYLSLITQDEKDWRIPFIVRH